MNLSNTTKNSSYKTMRAILNKIFLRKLGFGKFFISGIAFISGFTLVLLALQGYVKIHDYLHRDRNKDNYIILNKEVVMAHTLLGGKAQFSEEEVTDLRRQPFIDDMAAFKSNDYEVIARAGGEMGLITELFFESIPKRFIDSPTGDFTWEEGSNFVPIIISQDFIDLYNFGFALGRGGRQLSKSTIQLIPLTIDITGMGGRKRYNAKIVGFSERIPSVLVPEEFLIWTNNHIGNSSDEVASRIITKLKDNGANALEAYTKNHSLIVSDEKMKFGKILSTLDIFMTAVLLIGLGFVTFSVVIIILNFSLIVTQASEEVSLLLQLGYSGRQLVFHLSSYLIFFMIIVMGASGIAWWFGNNWLINLLVNNGIDVSKSMTKEAIWLATGAIVTFFLLSYFTIGNLIRKQQIR